MQRQYRKFVLQLYRQLRHPRKLKQSRIMRWFATHFLDKSVWRPTRHSFAGGMAVGLFISGLLIPGQMPIAAALCGIMRLNIPIAMVMCWLSNPLTFAPIAWWEISIGNWFMTLFNIGEPVPLRWSELTNIVKQSEDIWVFFEAVRPWAFSMYFGAVVGGLVLMPVVYGLVFGLWDLAWIVSGKKPAPVTPITKIGVTREQHAMTSTSSDKD